jgi:hypothetical protein
LSELLAGYLVDPNENGIETHTGTGLPVRSVAGKNVHSVAAYNAATFKALLSLDNMDAFDTIPSSVTYNFTHTLPCIPLRLSMSEYSGS